MDINGNMVIYNVGFPRTGTKFIVNIFKELGFKYKHPNLTNHYNFEFNYFKNNIEEYRVNNTYYSNTPFWHPESWNLLKLNNEKIIYSYRDKKSWINSIMNYKYFQKNEFFNRDEYWFKSYFGIINIHNLSLVYDKHFNDVYKLKNFLKINVIEENDEDIINKIRKFLNE